MFIRRRLHHYSRLALVIGSLLIPAAALSQQAGQPITVITDTMISNIGARTLRDVLITYVPGMTHSQDHNEVTVAMRGVYASAQQKILVVMDGHVLNSRSFSAASPDFSISLDKIARIEVIRGPASAMYGNGALAAVVRITTRTAAASGGNLLTAGIGTHGQVKISGVYNARTAAGGGVLAWGTYQASDGELVHIPASRNYSRTPGDAQAIIDGFSDRGAHDVGLKLTTGLVTFTAAHRYSKYTEPFTASGPTGEAYVYSDYQRGDGIGPGRGEGSLNIGAIHERTLGAKATVSVRGYFDRINHAAHLVADPAQRAHSLVVWSEWDAGAEAQVSREYTSGARAGFWRAGLQAEVTRVDDSHLSSGVNGGWSSTTPSGGLLSLGDEKTYSAFGAVSHPFASRWTATGALRYDVKVRRDDEQVRVVSPNVALTYHAGDRATVSVSYGRSFLDAPYFYRYNTLPSYRGARTLQPEYLESLQITPTVTIGPNLVWTTNVYLNSIEQLVYRNNTAGPAEPIYQNAGFLRTWGVEQELSWAPGPFDLTGNVTFQRVREADRYPVTGADVHNVPTWSGSAILNMRPAVARSHDLTLNLTLRAIGAQHSPIDLNQFVDPTRTVKGVVLVNTGARLGTLWSQPWFLDARIYNLFDTAYEQGGSVSHPYPQPGRWAMVTLGRTW